MSEQSGSPDPSGQQGAVSPEQLSALEERIDQTISRALTARLARLGLDQVSTRLEELASKLEAAPTSTSSARGDGKKTESETLREELGQLRKALATEQAEKLRERRTNALIQAIGDCKTIRPEARSDALAILNTDDVRYDDERRQWIGTGRLETGEPIPVPLKELVDQAAKARSHWHPPPAAGAGARGPGGMVSSTGKPLEQMTGEEARAMTRAEKLKAFDDLAGTSGESGGFFGP